MIFIHFTADLLFKEIVKRMKNSTNNIDAIMTVAKALGSINSKVTYVGGAVISLYINDPAAEDVRPTFDVDFFLQITSMVEQEKLRIELNSRGFKQTAEDNSMCRFRYKDIKVDVMSTKFVGWAPANPWFKSGHENLEIIELEGEKIKILSLPHFLATKYFAFKSRGSEDPRTSHDLEDIVYILDNRTDLVEIIKNAPEDVLAYLKESFKEMLNNELIQEAILGNLDYSFQTERFDRLRSNLRMIIDS